MATKLTIDTTKGYGVRHNEVRLVFTSNNMRYVLPLESNLAAEIGHAIVNASNLINHHEKINGEVVQIFDTLIASDMSVI